MRRLAIPFVVAGLSWSLVAGCSSGSNASADASRGDSAVQPDAARADGQVGVGGNGVDAGSAGGAGGQVKDAGGPDAGGPGDASRPDTGGGGATGMGGGGAGGAGMGGSVADSGAADARDAGVGGSVADSGAGDAVAPDTGTDVPRPAALTSQVSAHDFGHVEVGVASSAFIWSIANTGGVGTGTLSLTNDDPAEATVSNSSCAGSLAVAGGCSLSVTFKPSTGGARAATLTVSATPGGSVALTLTAGGQYRVTVTTTGTGTVTSVPAGISCGATCSTLVDPGAITLMARTTNGSGSVFSGWSDAGCSGPFRDCALNVAASLTVSARFVPMTANLIFVTAATFPANLGGAASYDAPCNQAASAAGINDAAGAGYIATVSDSVSLARDRLGATARGWMRMDGAPFADSQTALFTTDQVFNSIKFDETGARLSAATFFTGASSNGTASSITCSNWTVNVTGAGLGNSGMFGSADGGPGGWITGLSGQCDTNRALACMGKTRAAVVTPVVRAGKRIWQSTAYVVGAQSPDAKCLADRPANVTTAMAFVSFINRTAASVLSPTAIYVRPDGTQVGTGAQLAAGGSLDSGIWQDGTGAYSEQVVWSGSPLPGSTGTTDSTCANWTTQTGMGSLGWSPYDSIFWWTQFNYACTFMYPLYCVEP